MKTPLQASLRGSILLLGAFNILSITGGCSKPPPTGGVALQVVSSSMAPALVGPTRMATCLNCGHTADVAADTYRSKATTRCYLCGGQCWVASDALSGSVVQVTPLLDTAQLDRFALVAIEHDAPQSAKQLNVKRIWGLPGEVIAIAQGELWIDGQLLQKSLNQLRSLAVPVSQYAPSEPRSHWTAQLNAKTSPHSTATLHWRHAKPAATRLGDAPPAQWLEPGPMTDDSQLNQGPSFLPLATEDLLLTIALNEPLAGTLRVIYTYKATDYTILLHAIDVPETQGSSSIIQLRLAVESQIEIAFCDGRLMVSADGGPPTIKTLHTDILSDEAEQQWQKTRPSELTISTSPPADLGHVSIARDIVVRSSHRDPALRQDFQRLSPNTFFVLGDNQPVSVDSRTAGEPVRRSDVVGVVKKLR